MRHAAALLACASVLACSRERAAVDTSRASAVAQPAETPVRAAACPRTGHWSECALKLRLEQSGLAPHSTTETVGELPPWPETPITMKVGNGAIAFYLFPDSAKRRRSAEELTGIKYIRYPTPVSLRGETTIIENDNVLALLFSRNEHQRERVTDAITAGPPQP